MLKTRPESGRIRRANEHVAVLESACRFDSFYRMEDFLDDGVHSVFGVEDGEAELQALYFQADRFTLGEAEEWLRERRFPALSLGAAKAG